MAIAVPVRFLFIQIVYLFARSEVSLPFPHSGFTQKVEQENNRKKDGKKQ
jgi:hypothetical protein